MEKEFIPYEQALELKELGFDEPCIASYRLNRENQWVFDIREQNGLFWSTLQNSSLVESCTAPLYQQAFKWFREKYLDILVKDYGLIPHFTIIQNMFLYSDKIWTYEEAELACLKKLIEIVKNK